MIGISNLEHSYGKSQLFVQSGDIEIREGINYLVGLNGTGKTTLFKILLGILHPQSGEIFYDGAKIMDSLNRIGVVFDTPHFYPYLTGKENLDYFNEFLSHKATPDKINNLFAEWDMNDTTSKYKNYSLGMKKKLSIIFSLLSSPDYWFLDEPFNGLDTDSQKKLATALRLAQQNHKTILLSSHNLYANLSLADHILAIHNRQLKYYPQAGDRLAELLTHRILIPENVKLPKELQLVILSEKVEKGKKEIAVLAKNRFQIINYLQQNNVSVFDEYKGDDSLVDIIGRMEAIL